MKLWIFTENCLLSYCREMVQRGIPSKASDTRRKKELVSKRWRSLSVGGSLVERDSWDDSRRVRSSLPGRWNSVGVMGTRMAFRQRWSIESHRKGTQNGGLSPAGCFLSCLSHLCLSAPHRLSSPKRVTPWRRRVLTLSHLFAVVSGKALAGPQLRSPP